MEKIVSCCGVICSECSSFPADCKGCPEIKGKVYWLEYTGGSVCPIYDCCINKNNYQHCGKCKMLPCKNYGKGDPTKTDKENADDLKKQLENLNNMR